MGLLSVLLNSLVFMGAQVKNYGVLSKFGEYKIILFTQLENIG